MFAVGMFIALLFNNTNKNWNQPKYQTINIYYFLFIIFSKGTTLYL